ncbi:unnamed protein product [Vitrella brassicaformis CCMP3155]|uniref:Uncharacterized protein n=1 Tax=Vitrella brassicaformis (strain CCMP3155) TaxID=1169540 RepID=A0A0G4EPX1_VITBC|nr:unnamed protein product [Vitrella brassicaformis CCMP3155]|eukprot:CEL99330.1 unnamed protein product [Vitrella brassicaformis CCMP3155]
MRGTLACASFQSFNGRQLSCRDDLSMSLRCVLSLLSTDARTGWVPYQGAWKRLKATLAKYPPSWWEDNEVTDAIERFVHTRYAMEARWRREVANMMPESIHEGVFGGLRQLFATVGKLPFGKLEAAVYEGLYQHVGWLCGCLDILMASSHTIQRIQWHPLLRTTATRRAQTSAQQTQPARPLLLETAYLMDLIWCLSGGTAWVCWWFSRCQQLSSL